MQGVTTVELALRQLQTSRSEGWDAFCKKLTEISVSVDLSVLNGCLNVKSSREIPKRYAMNSRYGEIRKSHLVHSSN